MHTISPSAYVFSCSTNNNYLVLLSDAMSTGLGLYVVLWVPVTVKDDDRVSRCQVHTQTSGTCRQQETEILHADKHTHTHKLTACSSLSDGNYAALASATVTHTYTHTQPFNGPYLVAWHSGRTSVSGRWTFPVLRSNCSWWVTTNVGKPSATGQPTRPTHSLSSFRGR